MKKQDAEMCLRMQTNTEKKNESLVGRMCIICLAKTVHLGDSELHICVYMTKYDSYM